MDLLDSFLLGLIQGLTEFLPISSSGHLVLGKALLSDDLEKSITFEVVVHFGTLCSILIYYRKKLWSMIRSLAYLSEIRSEEIESIHLYNLRVTGFILLSMIPAVIVGFTLQDQIESLFLNPFTVSIMLLVTGAILFATRFRKEHTNDLTVANTFAIGLAQAFAILPGISRSGSTISLGLYLGIKREEVANFSFLMVIPVIAGAMLLQVFELMEKGVVTGALLDLTVGFVAALISGYFALKYLIMLLKTRGIDPFAWYCWALGITGLIYFW